MTENYSAFEGLNLSDARSKNETREEYKLRLKQNRQVMKKAPTNIMQKIV